MFNTSSMGRFKSFVLFLSCTSFTRSILAADFGVGFSLSLDYGVSSIYFSNGSSIGIAKVEGGPAYKEMMRTQDGAFHSMHSRRDNGVHHSRRSMQLPLGIDVQSLHDYLPPWLGGPDPDARVELLSRMLNALKTATESYVGSKVTDAEVVFPFYVPRSFLNALQTASTRISLNMPELSHSPAGLLAARANGMDSKCYPHLVPEQYILTMDYSRAALTAMLINEHCGVYEVLQGLHETSFGTDSWSNESWSILVSKLREVIRIPVGHGADASLHHISSVILLGESAGERRLRDALKEAWLDGAEHDASVISGSSEDVNSGCMVDPLYAAATGLAAHCLEKLNLGENEQFCSLPI